MAALHSDRWRFRMILLFWRHRSDAPPPAKLRVSGDPLLLPREAWRDSGIPPPSRCSTVRKACRTSSRGRLFLCPGHRIDHSVG